MKRLQYYGKKGLFTRNIAIFIEILIDNFERGEILKRCLGGKSIEKQFQNERLMFAEANEAHLIQDPQKYL